LCGPNAVSCKRNQVSYPGCFDRLDAACRWLLQSASPYKRLLVNKVLSGAKYGLIPQISKWGLLAKF
jgi:hypothetical protein